MRTIDLSTATWRKSSYSNSDGGECVEVSPDFLDAAAWRKSSHSNQDGGECIEITHDFEGLVPIRDSKNPAGPALILSAPAWGAFIDGVKAGG
ncbi:DUF397 domain-containing protein [Streptomyces silvensis]|uniref:DUF397 domain-containing protein n=1 Tax=Streptomyces silvensis TaxID=1765722 RepID=A0A0W7XAD1_9ACTN|nr:DUF397 domain-containing protein [Streptomyces silvensis]KUF19761.1 DUF397 domain-containing protein [Streptomyces silvensis]